MMVCVGISVMLLEKNLLLDTTTRLGMEASKYFSPWTRHTEPCLPVNAIVGIFPVVLTTRHES
jgi:hypothetical protein